MSWRPVTELEGSVSAEAVAARTSGKGDWGSRGLLVEVTELLEALERDQLCLVYQPVVDLEGLKVVGVEGLLRWRRANGEFVSPERIVSFGEAHGVSQQIANWVFTRAIEDATHWKHRGLSLELSVNASAEVVSHPENIGLLLDILQSRKFEPRRLTVEVTETDVIQQPEAALATLSRLRSFGIGVAMDDFGSGNSNLDRLQLLPFTQIKVDRSIVSPAMTNNTSARLVNFASMLGQALGLTVVAEGVETQATVELLRRCRIRRAQGYYFSEPVFCDQVPKVVQELDLRLWDEKKIEPSALGILTIGPSSRSGARKARPNMSYRWPPS